MRLEKIETFGRPDGTCATTTRYNPFQNFLSFPKMCDAVTKKMITFAIRNKFELTISYCNSYEYYCSLIYEPEYEANRLIIHMPNITPVIQEIYRHTEKSITEDYKKTEDMINGDDGRVYRRQYVIEK